MLTDRARTRRDADPREEQQHSFILRENGKIQLEKYSELTTVFASIGQDNKDFLAEKMKDRMMERYRQVEEFVNLMA